MGRQSNQSPQFPHKNQSKVTHFGDIPGTTEK